MCLISPWHTLSFTKPITFSRFLHLQVLTSFLMEFAFDFLRQILGASSKNCQRRHYIWEIYNEKSVKNIYHNHPYIYNIRMHKFVRFQSYEILNLVHHRTDVLVGIPGSAWCSMKLGNPTLLINSSSCKCYRVAGRFHRK